MYMYMYIYKYIHTPTYIYIPTNPRTITTAVRVLLRDAGLSLYTILPLPIHIPARCPLFSSLDRANDYAHSPIVAPMSPPRLSRALRTHTNAQSALSHPGMKTHSPPLSVGAVAKLQRMR